MDSLNISYHLLLVASCAYAWLRGGWEGKCVSTLLITSSALTTLCIAYLDWNISEQGLTAVIDTLLLVCLFLVGSVTLRFWPLWICGFHLLSVLTYLAWVINPTALPPVYQAVSAFWSIPILVVLAVGVFLDSRADGVNSGEPVGVGPVRP